MNKFNVGDKVFDIRHGWGIVIGEDDSDQYPVKVRYGDRIACVELTGEYEVDEE